MNQAEKMLSDFEHLEGSFYDLDEERKVAKITLEFDTVRDIFDPEIKSAVPVMNDHFLDLANYALVNLPKGYRLDLQVVFGDMEGYDEETLKEIFKKNVLFSVKGAIKEAKDKKNLAFTLMASGVLMLIITLLTHQLWTAEYTAAEWFPAFLRDLVFYVTDIFSTVLFWEAANILIVNSKEKAQEAKKYVTMFDGIGFRKKGE